MSVICIGPFCIPWTALWPIFIILFKPLWRLVGRYFNRFGMSEEKVFVEQFKDTTVTENYLTLDNESEWENVIGQDRLTLVRYTASWCKPCKRIEPYFLDLYEKFPTVQYVTVDVDKFPTLAVENGAIAIPHFLLFRAGKTLGKSSGVDEVALGTLIARNLD